MAGAWCAPTRSVWWSRLLVICVTCVLGSIACRGEHSSAARAAASSSALPTLVLRDDTSDLRLTWVDSTGDFHVATAIDQVPAESRERVRVVLLTKAEGTLDTVYVADLRQKSTDGTYPTSIIPRSAWEETGASRRKSRMETLAPIASLVPSPSSQSGPESPVAVIYGAEWCGACREAARYLKRKGIKFSEKDVDQSPAVQAELRGKLAKAGMPLTSSIPIIDIGGKLIVGFSQPAVDAALKAATR
jgi:glutaredoxin